MSLTVPPGVNYVCGCCGKPVTDWSARINPDMKLELVAECCGNRAEILLYLGIGGTLFTVDDRLGVRLHLARK
jgi:hypothetical protein